ncbi:MAG: hypothetical protein JW801_15480 [Bacteroidales bacterium]|nr:hypothetical protein [Bacteroidales bacterium]
MRSSLFFIAVLSLLSLACKEKTTQPKPSSQALLAEALLLEDSSRFGEAVVKLNEALKVTPNDIQILYYRGWDLYQIGELEKAFADFNKMVQLDSLSTAGLYGKALILYEDGKYEEALDYFYDIIRIQGDLDMSKNKLRKQPIIDAPLNYVFELKDSVESFLGVESLPADSLVPFTDENVEIVTVD